MSEQEREESKAAVDDFKEIARGLKRVERESELAMQAKTLPEVGGASPPKPLAELETKEGWMARWLQEQAQQLTKDPVEALARWQREQQLKWKAEQLTAEFRRMKEAGKQSEPVVYGPFPTRSGICL